MNEVDTPRKCSQSATSSLPAIPASLLLLPCRTSAWEGSMPLPGPRSLTAASNATPHAHVRRLKHASSHRSPCRIDVLAPPSCISPTAPMQESGRCQARNRSGRSKRRTTVASTFIGTTLMVSFLPECQICCLAADLASRNQDTS